MPEQCSNLCARFQVSPGILFFMTALLALLLILLGNAGADTLVVDDDGTTGYTTIQDAVNASRPEDHVLVLNGTYAGNITIEHNLLLEGESMEGVMIRGTGDDYVLRVEATDVTVYNMTITDSDPGYVTGLEIQDSRNVLVSRVNISKCFIGLFIYNSTHCQVSQLESSGNGYGVFMANSGNITVEDSMIRLSEGIGLLMGEVIDCSIRDVLVEDSGDYGVKTDSSGNCSFENVTADGNINSGIYAVDSNNITITDSRVMLNNNSGILLQSSPDCHFENVTADGNLDNGIYVVYSNRTGINRSSFVSNQYGISAAYSNTTDINGSSFVSNQYGIYAIYSNWTDIGGSSVFSNQYGICAAYSNSTNINDSSIIDNPYGITLVNAGSTRVSNSTIRESSGWGIYNYLSTSTTLLYNDIGFNYYGIIDQDSEDTHRNDNIFQNNTSGDYYRGTNTPPVPNLVSSTRFTGPGRNILFDASDSIDPDSVNPGQPGKDTSVEWYRMDFGDGNITDWTKSPYFYHSYANYGNITAYLYVKDSLGLESKSTDSVEILIAGYGGDKIDIFVDDDALDGGDGTLDRPYSTIHEAVNSSQPGAKIFVFEGDYRENILVDHSLSLEGEVRFNDNEPEYLVNMEGAAGLDVIWIKDTSGVILRNFSLSNSGEVGSGLAVSGCQDVRISDISVSGCYFGILVRSSSDCSISGEVSRLECSGNGCGIVIGQSSNILLMNALVRLNEKSGLLVDTSVDCSVVDVISTNNEQHGIALLHSIDCSLDRVISRDHVNLTGSSGIHVTDSNGTTLMDSRFFGNNYGIRVSDSSDCVIDDCTSGEEGGGNQYGIELQRTDNASINDSRIRHNDVVGIHNFLADTTHLTSNRIEENYEGVKDHYSVNTYREDNVFKNNVYADYNILINLPPVPRLRPSTTSADKNTDIFFDASASNDPNDDTPITWYRMDYGDGNITDWVGEPYFNFSYARDGYYTVKLYVKDSLGMEPAEPDQMYITIGKEKEKVSAFLVGSMATAGFLIFAIPLLGMKVSQLRKVEITESFLFYGNSGNLMCHAKKGQLPGGAAKDPANGKGDDVDAAVTIAMLSAIQDFIGDTFGKGVHSGIGRLEYGDSTIFVERGKYVNLAVVSNRSDKIIKHYLKKTIYDVEEHFGAKLVKWNGDVTEMEGAWFQLNEGMTTKSVGTILKLLLQHGRTKDRG